jgi:hypothetical protein
VGDRQFLLVNVYPGGPNQLIRARSVPPIASKMLVYRFVMALSPGVEVIETALGFSSNWPL